MTFTIPLWTLIPGALLLAALWLMGRKSPGWDFLSPLAALACLFAAALFLLGRCIGRAG